MRYPSFIEKGNTIGFVAPSFGCAGEPYYSAFQNSLKKWNALGFKTESVAARKNVRLNLWNIIRKKQIRH